MANRKIVFVIVEGQSDETALGYMFDKIFDLNYVFVKIMRCDIMTKNGIKPQNILGKITEIVKEYADSNQF